MEAKEEKRLPGVLLTFLFIYFYVIVRSIWDYGSMLVEWGEDHFIINGALESWGTLVLNLIAWTYALISLVAALYHHRGCVATLRWSVFFILGIAGLEILGLVPDIRALLTSTFKLFRFLFLLIFYIYLWTSKSVSTVYPKGLRKFTWIPAVGLAVFLLSLCGLFYAGYRAHQETRFDNYFDDEQAGTIKGDSLFLSCGAICLPKGYTVDSIAIHKGLYIAKITSEHCYAVAMGDIMDERSLRQHYMNCRQIMPVKERDFLRVENATPLTVKGYQSYLSAGMVVSEKDTLDWRMISVFDSISHQGIGISLLSDSINADEAIKKLANGVRFYKSE